MFKFDLWAMLLRNLDAGAGGGAAGGGSAGAGGAGAGGAPAEQGAAAAGGQPGREGLRVLANGDGGQPGQPNAGGPQGQPSGSPYYPDGLGEAMRGKTDRETIDLLTKELGGRPKPPVKPEDYKLELTPELQKRFGDMSDDPALPVFKAVAHELGIPADKFGPAYMKLYDGLVKAGAVEHVDFEAELTKLEPRDGRSVTEKRAVVAQRVNGAINWVKGLETGKQISKGEATMLTALASAAEGVMLLEKLRTMTGEHGVQPGGQGGSNGLSKDSVLAMERDERYDTRSPKYDVNFRMKADEARRNLFGAR